MAKEFSSNNAFVDSAFDRLGHRRTDERWLQQSFASRDTRFIGVWKHRCALVQNSLYKFSGAEVRDFDLDNAILLGEVNGSACFALDFGQHPEPPASVSHCHFHGLRTIGMTLDASEAALAAYAQAMTFWHRRHRFCGACGNASVSAEAGHVLDCSVCDNRSFPRSDPAVIVLASRDDRVLLGRQATWPQGRYSTIAGFVEPGESLEDTVRREVTEETGHEASSVRYFSSQPWPFPSSLMLGFSATVSAEPVRAPDEELEEIRWFTREEIIERETNGPKLVPPPLSIAYRLIEHWFNLRSDVSLADISGN